MILNVSNQHNSSYKPQFMAIQLSEKEAKTAVAGIRELYNLNIEAVKEIDLNILRVIAQNIQIVKNKLFKIFDEHLKKEALIRTNKFYVYKDVLAEIYLKFSELLEEVKNNQRLEISQILEEMVNKLNEYKPSKYSVKSEYIHPSLDENVYWDKDLLKLVDRVVSDDLPTPKSSEYLDAVKIRVKKAINQENLPIAVKKRILARLNGVKYKDIAAKDDINISVAKSSVKKGVLKIQHANGTLPKKCIEKAEYISKLFKCDVEKAIKFILKNPAILDTKPETIMQNIRDTANLLSCSEEKLIKISLKYPDICLQKPETLMNNISQSVKILGCSKEKFIKAGFNMPPLFYYAPETLLNHVKKASEIFGCTELAYIRAALLQPQLFCQKPETLNSNIENTAIGLECTKEELVKAALCEPPIFCLKPETILNNVKESSKLFHCSEKEFIQVALKTPKLLYLRAETLKRKAEEISKNFGCTKYEFMKMSLDYPYLLCQNATTIGEKLKIENYYKKIKNEEPKKVPCKNSKESVYLNIITYLLQKAKFDGTEDFVKVKRNFNLQEFTKAFFDKEFSFEIPEDEAAKGFIDFVQETSVNTIGKNIFEFKIVA